MLESYEAPVVVGENKENFQQQQDGLMGG